MPIGAHEINADAQEKRNQANGIGIELRKDGAQGLRSGFLRVRSGGLLRRSGAILLHGKR
jgi:hypothetical protein